MDFPGVTLGAWLHIHICMAVAGYIPARQIPYPSDPSDDRAGIAGIDFGDQELFLGSRGVYLEQDLGDLLGSPVGNLLGAGSEGLRQ